MSIHVSQHPLVLHKLAVLRDRATAPPLFRQLLRDLAQLLFFEATRDLQVKPITVATPLADCTGQQLAQSIGLMPILRAGLGMAEAILELVPDAEVWHLGLYRDHETLKPITYYSKLPEKARVDVSILIDPMLATGGSAVAAVELLQRWGAQRIKYLALIAAPEGVQVLHQAYPDVSIYLGAIDSHLNEHSYIVPGLGDAGDRQFGTM